jgi:ParB-like chromosome segregation protein Spo0J
MAEPTLPHLVDVRKLLDFERNARTHSDAQIEQLKASFRKFGFVGVIAYAGTGLKIGHGRKRAALEMWEAGEEIWGPGRNSRLPKWKLPAVDVSNLSDDEMRALVIADNKLAMNAGWDEDILRDELLALQEIQFDMPVIGFDLSEIDKLFNVKRTEADPDKTPEPPAKPASRRGDLWILGEHRLMCGDATDAADVKSVLDEKADLTLTDPPYGIGYDYASHDDRDAQANADLVARVFALGPQAKVWTPGLMNLARDISRFGQTRQVFWHKGFAAAGNGLGGASTVEPVLVLDPPRKALPNDYLHFGTDRLDVAGQDLRDLHPCPKPVALYAHLAEAFTERGGVIYEPFGGSGTTLIACEQTGRRCRAMEIDPAYCDVIVQRWQEFADKEATLAANGQTFAEVRQDAGLNFEVSEAPPGPQAHRG